VPPTETRNSVLFGFDVDPIDEDVRASSVAQHADSDQVGGASESVPLWRILLAAAFGALIASAIAWLLWPESSEQLSVEDIDSAIADALDQQARGPTSATVAYQEIAPSLVGVRTLDGDDVSNIGAGVVINDGGQIITSLHVVTEATSIELAFADGTVSSATIASADPALDIALLTADRPGLLVPVVIGNSRTLEIGDQVFAVGNPLGLSASITSGVISGLNRDVPLPGVGDDPAEDDFLNDLIQFDAAVNQGSSGGPLLNTRGQVVGIVTTLADPAEQGVFVGIGFAVPIDIAAGQAADGPSQ